MRAARTTLRPLLLLSSLVSTSAFALRSRPVATAAFSSASRPNSRRPALVAMSTTGELLETCNEACDALSEMLVAIYALVSDKSGTTTKQDKSVFTLADGLVQALLKRMLAPHVGAIVGEEDESELNVDAPPFRAGELVAPEDLNRLVEGTRDKLDALSRRLEPGGASHLVAFIDPIDGTREFATKKGEQCTICIGFARGDTGEAHAGLVYRPLTAPPTFALGCAAEGVARSSLDLGLGGATAAPPRTHTPPSTASARGLMCSNGNLSPFTQALAVELGSGLVRAGGAGNKVLLLLEGKGQSYIQDRGVSRWDTCAAQAVLEAHGGCLAKLAAFAASPEAESSLATYRYVPSETNADFEPGLASLTAYNAKEPPEAAADGGAPPRATAVEQLKPYANTCGLFALAPSEMGDLAEYRRAIAAATAQHPPAYD